LSVLSKNFLVVLVADFQISCCKIFVKNTKFGAEIDLQKFRDKIEILSTKSPVKKSSENFQMSIGKLRLSTPNLCNPQCSCIQYRGLHICTTKVLLQLFRQQQHS